MKAGDTGARAEREADGGDARIPSRAAAAAQRRINASAARRRARCEVLLTTSKDVTPAQYQQLLNFVKGLQLPPDATALVTTVSADQFVATTSSSNLNPSVPAAEGQSAQHGGHQGGAAALLGRTRIPVRRGFEHRRPSTGVGAAL